MTQLPWKPPTPLHTIALGVEFQHNLRVICPLVLAISHMCELDVISCVAYCASLGAIPITCSDQPTTRHTKRPILG